MAKWFFFKYDPDSPPPLFSWRIVCPVFIICPPLVLQALPEGRRPRRSSTTGLSTSQEAPVGVASIVPYAVVPLGTSPQTALGSASKVCRSRAHIPNGNHPPGPRDPARNQISLLVK